MASNNRAFAGIVAFLIIALVGAWTYSAFKKRSDQRAIVEAVTDATERLRQTLGVVPNAGSRGALGKLQANMAAVDADLDAVRQATSSEKGLADGAELYVLGAREILRQQAQSIRVADQAAASREALINHMRRASRRDGNWIHEAFAQKKRVETDYFNYKLALNALAEHLWTFPDARKKLKAHIDDTLLLEIGPAEDAHRLVLKESRRAADDLDFLRRLAMMN